MEGMDARTTDNGLNGYLADGTRVQVSDWYHHSVYEVREFPKMSQRAWQDMDPGALVQFTKRSLHRLHYLHPRDVLGPVEGDGSWWTDPLDGARIVTLWVEQGSAMWNRMHRRMAA